MNTKAWFSQFTSFFATPGRQTWGDDGADYASPHAGPGAWFQSVTGRSPELLDAADEVAAEQKARLCVACRAPTLGPRFVAYLRQQPIPTPARALAAEGVWLFAALPAVEDNAVPEVAAPDDPTWDDGAPDWDDNGPVQRWLTALENRAPDLILYLIQSDGAYWHDDGHWLTRLRTLGAPLLPVLVTPTNGCPSAAEQAAEIALRVQGKLGIRPALFTIGAATDNPHSEPPTDVIALAQRMLGMRPRIAIPLAQDAPWCRTLVAQRTVRTAALLTSLVGAQPIPLLDLPVQVAVQWKMALQLATIYGRPGLDYRSREMGSTVVVNVVARLIAQQLVKLAPGIGWLLSGIISGLSALLLGQTLIRFYAGDPIAEVQTTSAAMLDRTRNRVDPLVAGCRARFKKVPRVGFRRHHRNKVQTDSTATAPPIPAGNAEPGQPSPAEPPAGVGQPFTLLSAPPNGAAHPNGAQH